MMSRTGRDSARITVLNAMTQLASLVLFAAIARVFGITARTDAFFLALTLPSVLVGPVVSAVRAVLVPILVEIRELPEVEARFVGSVLIRTFLYSALAVVALVLAAPVLIPVAAGGMAPEDRALVVRLTMLLLPLVVAQSVAEVLSAAFNASGRFALPSAAAGIRHVVALGVILTMHDKLGVLILPLGFVAGALVQLATLVAGWRSVGIQIAWTLRAPPEWRRSVKLALPLILASVILYLAALILRSLAAWLPPGSVTILDYATRMISALMEVLTSGVMVVVLSRWSHLANSASSALNASLQRSVVLVLFAVAPVLAALAALRVPAVSLVLGRGSIQEDLVVGTAAVFAILLVGVPLDIVSRMLTRVFLVRQATWVNASAALIRFAVVAVLALLLLSPVGLPGLAIAEVAGIAAVVVFLAWVSEPGAKGALAGTGPKLLRMTALAAVGGVAAGAVSEWLGERPPMVIFAAGSIVTLAVYTILSAFVQSDELRTFGGMLRVSRRR